MTNIQSDASTVKKTAKNLTQKDEYSFLPDAPAIWTAHNYETESPYHISAHTPDKKFMVLAQIRGMAIAFVGDFSKRSEIKLDFSRESLGSVDKIIEAFKPANKESVEIFVAECGSYIGEVLRGLTSGKGKWHVSYPQYFFSGFRFPYQLKSKEGKSYVTIVETSPYAAVSKRLISLKKGKKDAEPSIEKYVNFLFEGFSKTKDSPPGEKK